MFFLKIYFNLIYVPKLKGKTDDLNNGLWEQYRGIELQILTHTLLDKCWAALQERVIWHKLFTDEEKDVYFVDKIHTGLIQWGDYFFK